LSDTAGDAIARPAGAASLSALGLSALGVVFGDIGTSPLYTLKTVLGLTGGGPDSVVTLGVLSLVIWTLIVVTTINTCPTSYVKPRDRVSSQTGPSAASSDDWPDPGPTAVASVGIGLRHLNQTAGISSVSVSARSLPASRFD
jgi:hypothetical protein